MSSAPECIGRNCFSRKNTIQDMSRVDQYCISNSSSSARSTSSASAGWSSEHKSVRLPRRMIASKSVDGQLLWSRLRERAFDA